MNEVSAAVESGYIDEVGNGRILGWLYQTGLRMEKPEFRCRIDGEVEIVVAADLFRADTLSAGQTDARTGFLLTLPTRFQDGAEHEVAFFNTDQSPLYLKLAASGKVVSHVALWGAAAIPAEDDRAVVVHIDRIGVDGIHGWADDRDDPMRLVALDIFIDGAYQLRTVCDLPRGDVARLGYPRAEVGFHITIPPAFFDDAVHELGAVSAAGGPLRLIRENDTEQMGCKFLLPSSTCLGQVDGLSDGAVRGWVLRRNHRTREVKGGQEIIVRMGNQPVARLRADHFRPDVATAHAADPNCGFVFVPPPELVAGQQVELGFTALPGGWELRDSPFKCSFPDAQATRAVRGLIAAVDALFVQTWALRDQLKGMLPAPHHTLRHYDAWAKAYFRHQATLPVFIPPEPPLVSILCPAYRPRLEDFNAAIESVLAQSYPNWELIIVDDASAAPELTALLARFAARDKRVIVHAHAQNGGISAATNTALGLARGRYVAFFDHDDLLTENALERMVAEALRTGAKLLYSDEDKIDDTGTLCEVNLKPDWNYRLLCAQNYVCHLLFVERELLGRAGRLRTEMDGAQDHDLVLRLAEITPPAHIHHVPEILYHWRKTPFSASASGQAKPYAAAAGVRAVQGHLARRGLSGEVRAIHGSTLYAIDWRLREAPSVTIIIPYRDHIGMTAECVAALRRATDYPNYDIILMDNWSVTDAAFSLAAEQAALPRTRVIRNEERFNFSRLNNIAVAATRAEFVLFMNNDVIVSEPDWLTQMVGEAGMDAQIGIVGNKLLYPDGRVQHGGVILGVGGVADHAHRSLGGNDPGYMARAICAQELSAVTAACLLCRRDVFHLVGGFDEQDLAIAFNDVDLCLKVREAGYRVIWTPGSRAEHRESISRGSDFEAEHQSRFFHENEVMRRRWARQIAADPFYNPNFSRRGGMFLDLANPGAEAERSPEMENHPWAPERTA